MRIGLIHVTQRLDSWGHFWCWELRRRGHEVIYMPETVGPHSESVWRDDIKCDWYLRIDDSQDFDTPVWCRPLIYLCSDTHVSDGVNRLNIAAHSRYTFYCQKQGLDKIVSNTGLSGEWMPHAAWFFPERAKEMKFDVCSHLVMGEPDHPIFGERTQLRDRILREFPELGCFIHGGPIHDDMANNYAAARIVWHHSVGNDIAMRHFEGAACGACVVSSRIKDNGMEEVFGDLIPQYDTPDECIDLIRSLLDKPGECAERGRELRKLVEAMHAYRHRVDRVLGKAKELMR